MAECHVSSLSSPMLPVISAVRAQPALHSAHTPTWLLSWSAARIRTPAPGEALVWYFSTVCSSVSSRSFWALSCPFRDPSFLPAE